LPARFEYHNFKKGQVAGPLKEQIGSLVQRYEREQAQLAQIRQLREQEAEYAREAQEEISLAA